MCDWGHIGKNGSILERIMGGEGKTTIQKLNDPQEKCPLHPDEFVELSFASRKSNREKEATEH